MKILLIFLILAIPVLAQQDCLVLAPGFIITTESQDVQEFVINVRSFCEDDTVVSFGSTESVYTKPTQVFLTEFKNQTTRNITFFVLPNNGGKQVTLPITYTILSNSTQVHGKPFLIEIHAVEETEITRDRVAQFTIAMYDGKFIEAARIVRNNLISPIDFPRLPLPKWVFLFLLLFLIGIIEVLRRPNNSFAWWQWLILFIALTTVYGIFV